MILQFPNSRAYPDTGRKPVMPEETSLWHMEERFWCDGVANVRATTSPDAIVILPDQTNLLRGSDIWDGLNQRPRWRSVAMLDRNFDRHGDTVTLAYRVSANEAGRAIYEALCISSYRLSERKWMRVSHQQTPLQ